MNIRKKQIWQMMGNEALAFHLVTMLVIFCCCSCCSLGLLVFLFFSFLFFLGLSVSFREMFLAMLSDVPVS